MTNKTKSTPIYGFHIPFLFTKQGRVQCALPLSIALLCLPWLMSLGVALTTLWMPITMVYILLSMEIFCYGYPEEEHIEIHKTSANALYAYSGRIVNRLCIMMSYTCILTTAYMVGAMVLGCPLGLHTTYIVTAITLVRAAHEALIFRLYYKIHLQCIFDVFIFAYIIGALSLVCITAFAGNPPLIGTLYACFYTSLLILPLAPCVVWASYVWCYTILNFVDDILSYALHTPYTVLASFFRSSSSPMPRAQDTKIHYVSQTQLHPSGLSSEQRAQMARNNNTADKMLTENIGCICITA